MPKRKREDDTGPPLSARQQRIQHKLEQGVRKIATAVKLAKSFERQKLGRREKTARAEKNDKDAARVESEIAALKTLDHAASAQTLLYKTLSRIKSVTSSDSFIGLLVAPPAPQDIAAQNVHGRLCNSKQVKDALNAALDDILDAAHIQLQDGKKAAAKPKKAMESTNTVKGTEELDVKEDTSVVGEGDVDMLSDAALDTTYTKYEHRLASSEDESDQDASDMDVSRLEQQLKSEGVRGRSDYFSGSEDEEAEEPESDDDFDGFESSGEPPEAAVKPKKSAMKKDLPRTSTILPSLTMGGYISGSDGEDIEEIDVAPRKNRRGQQARRLIAEKKFGQKAKHLQKQAQSRDHGWDAKRGATEARRGKFGSRGDRSGPNQKQNANLTKAKKDDSGPLHPSWEAAKRAKEKSFAMPAFAGKKISFD